MNNLKLKNPRKSNGKRKAQGKGGSGLTRPQLLEQAAGTLTSVGFSVHKSNQGYLEAESLFSRSLVQQWPYKTGQGTIGHKDALIVAYDCCGDDFVSDEDGLIRIVLEMKYEERQGTAFQKVGSEYLKFLEFEVPNFIIIYAGSKWLERAPKELLALIERNWERNKNGYPDKTFRIMTPDEFYLLVRRCWGISPNTSWAARSPQRESGGGGKDGFARRAGAASLMTAVNIHSVPHSRMVTRIRGYTGDVEWFTPTKYLESVRHVFGGRIDLDPASSDAAQLNVDAKQYFTVDDDGLAQQWRGNVFLNPPYAMPWIDLFVNKIVESYTAKEITQGILLTNNATDTRWFHLALQHCNAVCFTRGRISFIKSINGTSLEKGSPAVGQAFFYFGSGASRFESGFSLYGRIVRIIQRGGGQ